MPISLKIKLDNRARLYLPGQAIEGSVVVSDLLKSSFGLKGLRLRLVGEIMTFQIVGAYGELREVVPVVDKEIDLLDGQAVQVTKGDGEFQFSITLPENCPPTITVSESNRIRYALVAETAKSSRFTSAASAKTTIRVAALRPAEKKRQAVMVRMFGDVPFVAGEPVVEFGDGQYFVVPAESAGIAGAQGTVSADSAETDTEAEDDGASVQYKDTKDESKIEYYAVEYSDDESEFEFPKNDAHGVVNARGGGVIRHQRVGVFGREFVNKMLPQKRWGHGMTHANQLVLEAVFPHTGVYTDRPLALPARLLATGPLPPLVLHMFKITLIESTFISAKGVSNNERRRHTLLHIQGPIDLTAKSVHELSSELRNAFPPDLAATFSEPTMKRSYALNVHVQYYKGRIEDEQPVAKLHMNARHDLHVLGAADLDPVQPSSGSIFSFRTSAPSLRS